MVFRLPRLQSALRIVDDKGRPNLTFMRWWNTDVAGAIETQEAAQAETDAALAAAIADILAAQAAAAVADAKAVAAQEDVDGALDGTLPFTGLNVGGDDKVGFLAKVASGALADPTGLGAEVVETAAIATTAVSSTESAFSLSSVSLNTTSQVTVQQFTIDVEDGDQLIIMATASIRAVGVGGGTRGDFINRPTLTLYRGTTYLGGTRPTSVLRDMDLYASAAVFAIDTPPAGTHTIYLYSDLSATTDIATLTADNRFLGCLRRRLDR